MAWWITVYCTQAVSHLTGAQLLDGIRARDAEAPAGVDYHTLAEDYDVDEDAVGPALTCLRVKSAGKLPLEVAVHYHPDDDMRPVMLHCWKGEARVAEELEEMRDIREPPKAAEATLARTVEIVGIELGASQFGTMAVVLAYEIARYLTQKGDGLFVDDENEWYVVDGGALVSP
jgi:hypothetical protein